MVQTRKNSDRKALLASARTGNAEAQFALAKSYEREAPRDIRRAKHWYLKAATQGLASAQRCIGDVVKANATTARAWYTQAAMRGHVASLYALSDLAKKLALERHWLGHAAANGHIEAQIDLGIAYHNGKLVARDYVCVMRAST